MTNIKFVINELQENQLCLKMDKGTNSKDYKNYEIVGVSDASNDLLENTEKRSYVFANDVITTPSIKEGASFCFRVRLKRKDLENSGSKSRVYFVYVQKKDEKVDVRTRSKMLSGTVNAKTWDDSIWCLNEENLINEYAELLLFYVLNTPSKVKNRAPSKQSITNLYEKWGENCFKSRGDGLKAQLSTIKVEGILDKTRGVGTSLNDMSKRIIKLDLGELNADKVRQDNFDYRIRVSMVDTESNQYLSLFRHIRNSIAHGSFLIVKRCGVDYYIFQDSQKTKVTARGILTMKILSEWKSILVSK